MTAPEAMKAPAPDQGDIAASQDDSWLAAIDSKPVEEAGEQQLIAAMANCVDDPLGYVCMAFDWGQGPLKRWSGPDDWQAEVLSAVGNGSIDCAEALRLAVSSGHGVGKSALVAWIILWTMSTRPHLAGVCTANTKAQLEKKTWRELAIWHKRAINSHWFKWSATKFCHVKYRPDN